MDSFVAVQSIRSNIRHHHIPKAYTLLLSRLGRVVRTLQPKNDIDRQVIHRFCHSGLRVSLQLNIHCLVHKLDKQSESNCNGVYSMYAVIRNYVKYKCLF